MDFEGFAIIKSPIRLIYPHLCVYFNHFLAQISVFFVVITLYFRYFCKVKKLSDYRFLTCVGIWRFYNFS